MKPLPIVVSGTLALAALSAGPALSQAAPQKAPPAVKAAPAKTAPAADAEDAVEPGAREALQRMSAYLRSLNSFELTTDTSLDIVTESGQRIQLDGGAHYRARKPNAFVIDVNTDWKKRTYYYDGKTFTIYAPEKGFYATAPAPPTTLQTLDVIWQKFGIALPIEDLFRWSAEDGQHRLDQIDSGFLVGEATIGGAKTEQYAFRQGDLDWQVWIEKGDRPLPRKLMIVDRSQEAQPAYEARLTWVLNPTLSDDVFAFKAGPNAQRIKLTTLTDGDK